MTENEKKVVDVQGQTTVKSERISSKNAEHSATETTEKGSMSNEQVINLEDLKEAWLTFAEQCYEDNCDEANAYFGNIDYPTDAETAKAYIDAARTTQDFYFEIDEGCNSMEDYENIDFEYYLLDMLDSGWVVTKDDIISYAINCDIDEEIAKVMANVIEED